MSTGEVRQADRAGHVYPWYMWWRCARFWRARDSCPSIVYSALQGATHGPANQASVVLPGIPSGAASAQSPAASRWAGTALASR